MSRSLLLPTGEQIFPRGAPDPRSRRVASERRWRRIALVPLWIVGMYLQHFTEGDSRGIGHVVMAIFLVILAVDLWPRRRSTDRS